MNYNLAFICLLILCSCQQAQEESTAISINVSTKSLITVNEVDSLLKSNVDISILEVAKPEQFAKGHLPFAQQIWRPDYENKTNFPYSGMMANRAHMEALLSSKGVSNSKPLILYDSKGNCDAIRVQWILAQYGFDQVKIMDGGKVKWKQNGFPLSQEETMVDTTDFKWPKNESIAYTVANMKDVRQAISDTNYILLDTRNLAEYNGAPFINKGKVYRFKKGAFTNGRIPTALHYNWSNAVDLKGDHCVKSLQDLRYDMEQLGINPDKKIITYCQSGVRSAHTAYILKSVLNYPHVQNYDGSWIEWSYHHSKGMDLPIHRETSATKSDSIFHDLKRQETL